MNNSLVKISDLDQQLLEAARHGNADQCLALLERGADVCAATNLGFAALQFAAADGHTQTCELLIDKGSDVNVVTFGGATTLHLAAGSGHTQVCKLLIEKGADIHALDNCKRSALHIAIMYGHFHTATMHEPPHTCITLALLAHGADPSLKCSEGKTALDLAMEEGYADCVNAMRACIASQAARQALQEIALIPPLKP